jgi:hypothetical protein
MDGHVPTWLPAGMGLVQAFGSSWARGGAYFADSRCREVELWLLRSRGQLDGPDRTGSWVVDESAPRACGNAVLGDGRCIDYHVNVDSGQVVVQMMGIERGVADRIVESIPT